jgi:hypothetical protein
MRRRIAATVLLVAGSSVMISGCDGQLIDAIESAAPSASITLPALPTGDADPETDQPAEQEPAEQPPAEQLPSEQTPAEQTPAQSPTATDEADVAADTGVSTWAWVVLALLLVLLVVLLVLSARRRRGAGDKQLAAQADGQLGWVRSNVDDPLVRWRADQLRVPAAQRDTDTELARRWMLLDQRVTAATNDLLTVESSSKNDTLRQAASMLRQAAEGYRTSVDALAQSIATGEQARIAQASQALTADTTLLDQARQRLRGAAKL